MKINRSSVPVERVIFPEHPRKCHVIGRRVAKRWSPERRAFLERVICKKQEPIMGFGRGILLWLLGIPLPIIILLALFWR